MVLSHHLTTHEDSLGNNILHFVGKLNKLNRMSGAALQMQRELQWFKEVEKVILPSLRDMKNKDNKTPAMLFTEHHATLVKREEEWMKVAATSCTVVAAFIATVAFAAVFTAPGGEDDGGRPIYIHRQAFMVYSIADAIAFFFSCNAMMMFLSILPSRYLEEDFLESLPKKMMFGLLTMFMSLISLMFAYSSSIHLLLVSRCTKRSWDEIPILTIASILIALFVFTQFPLLMEIIRLTYGSGIFVSRKKKRIY